jgi:SAM-dependent methyltransferase
VHLLSGRHPLSVTDFDAQERRNWSGAADSYGRSYARVCAGAVPQLIDSARVRPGLRVLDVGTGTGTVAAAATSLGAEVTAVDADPAMVATAARLVPGVKCHVAVLPALPFGDGQFDAVLANFVINHVGRPLAALTEMGRVTAPGGHVIVTIWPQPPSRGVALLTRAIRDCGAERGGARLAPQDEFPRDEGGLRGLVAAAGLRGAACKSVDWQLVVDPAEWWGIASGASWMPEFKAHHSARFLGRVRHRFEHLSREFITLDGRLAVPIRALLATGQARPSPSPSGQI